VRFLPKKGPTFGNARVGADRVRSQIAWVKTKTLRPTRAADKGGASRTLKNISSAHSGSATVHFPSWIDIKSILVPVDFSAPSKKALAYAVPFAQQVGAKLILLHIVEPVAMPDFAKSLPLMMENDKIMAACKGQLERTIKEQAVEPALIEKTLVRYGRSFHEITDAARTLKVDLILLSTHGYTGLKHALLGSTTERVVRHAPCPVLVVRQ
jgi:universal stress protein A